jgi:hypothetical protein
MGQRLKNAGKLLNTVFAALLPPMVHKEELADAVGYIENAGVPTGVTPDFIGQKLFDTTNLVHYVATATTAGAWQRTGAEGALFGTQAAPAAKTTSATLTAAELLTRLITGNQGAAGAASYQLPTASDLETAWDALVPGGVANDDSFDFHVINLSTVAAEDITLTTNTGWTLVGSMVVIEQAAGNPAGSNGHFRVRRTAENTMTLYRIA